MEQKLRCLNGIRALENVWTLLPKIEHLFRHLGNPAKPQDDEFALNFLRAHVVESARYKILPKFRQHTPKIRAPHGCDNDSDNDVEQTLSRRFCLLSRIPRSEFRVFFFCPLSERH